MHCNKDLGNECDLQVEEETISEETLNKAINFRENHTSISLEKIRITKQSRKSILFYDNEP